jgi:hypothetical protein
MLDIEPDREFVVDDAAPPTGADGSNDPAPAVGQQLVVERLVHHVVAYFARRNFLSTLPTLVRGISGRTSIRSGSCQRGKPEASRCP